MHEYGSLACGFGFMNTEVATAARYFVALFYQFEEVSWLGSSSKVWPVRVLQLRYLSNGLERKGRVREAEMPNKNERSLIAGRIKAFCGSPFFSGS